MTLGFFYGQLYDQSELEPCLQRLTSVLRGAGTDAWAILEVTGSQNRFLQLQVGRDGELVGEVVSDQFLCEEERWTSAQHKQLLDLGWRAPSPAVAVADNPDSDLLNYRVSWAADQANEATDRRAASLFATTLETVFGVVSIEQLETSLDEDRFWENPETKEVDWDLIPRDRIDWDLVLREVSERVLAEEDYVDDDAEE